jgi:hypothetical protein
MISNFVDLTDRLILNSYGRPEEILEGNNRLIVCHCVNTLRDRMVDGRIAHALCKDDHCHCEQTSTSTPTTQHRPGERRQECGPITLVSLLSPDVVSQLMHRWRGRQCLHQVHQLQFPGRLDNTACFSSLVHNARSRRSRLVSQLDILL